MQAQYTQKGRSRVTYQPNESRTIFTPAPRYNDRLGGPIAHRVGDILWAKRFLGEGASQALFHHAGIVSKVDPQGGVLEVQDFGPGSSGQEIHLAEALRGFYTKPRVLWGNELTTAFPIEDTFVYARGPTTATEAREVLRRLDDSRGVPRRYWLPETNCQYYATEMRYGVGESGEGKAALAALREGNAAGCEAVRRFRAEYGDSWLKKGPEASLWNSIRHIILGIVVIIFCILLYSSATVLTAGTSYLAHRQAHLDDDNKAFPLYLSQHNHHD